MSIVAFRCKVVKKSRSRVRQDTGERWRLAKTVVAAAPALWRMRRRGLFHTLTAKYCDGDATTSKRAIVLFAGLLLIATVDARVQAETLPTLTLRYLAIEADVILVGEPVASGREDAPPKFKVTRVLKGPESLVSREVNLRDEGLYKLGPPWTRSKDDAKPLPRITKALLFLKNPPERLAGEGYNTVLSGIRALTEDGRIFVPQRLISPEPQYLLPAEGVTWEAMLDRVQQDLPKIARIRELGRILDHHQRNKAILAWIEEHQDEFEGGYYDEEEKGWASLQQQLFDWVMESCIPEDCWRAIELAVQVGSGPEKFNPSFCSPRGRELLLEKVFDSKTTDFLRLKALQELGKGGNSWYPHRNDYPRTQVVTREEQKTIIERITPLLKRKEPSWRLAAVRCLMGVSWPYDANYHHMISKQAIPQLVELYRSQRNPDVRSLAAEAIRRIGGEAFWRELTGNP